MLSPEQTRAARLRAIGTPRKDVATMVGRSYGTVTEWERNPEFMAKVEEIQASHERALEEALLEGEKAAVASMIEALDAVDREGHPDWNTRTKAAMRFLEMQGKRGKPTERVEQTTTQLSGDLNAMLEAALRDPAVRAIITRERLILPAAEEPVAEADFEVLDE